MKQLFIFILFMFNLAKIMAHPSFGLVITAENHLVFCDVLHKGGTIWQLDNQGKLTHLLTGEHCHFIILDHRGYIWGTNDEYLESTDENRSTLWKLKNNKKEIIISPTTDPKKFAGCNFVVDKQGNIFFHHDKQLYKHDKSGHTQLYLNRVFGRINSLQMDDRENIYVMDMYEDEGTIFKIDPSGQIARFATHVIEQHPQNPPFPEARFNMFFGAFVDQGGNIFVTNSGPRRVLKITPDGEKEHIYHSEAPWYPVAFTQKDGIAYVMEMGYEGGRGNFGPRIMKISEGKSEVLVDVENYEKKPEVKREENKKRQYGYSLVGPCGNFCISHNRIYSQKKN